MADTRIGGGGRSVGRAARLRHHRHLQQVLRAAQVAQAPRSEGESRPSRLDVAGEIGGGLGGFPDFSRPVTRTRAS